MYQPTGAAIAAWKRQMGACYLPLQTRSRVLTCVPSSMVCRVKSISGRGFFSFTARMAVSRYLDWSKGCWAFSMLGDFWTETRRWREETASCEATRGEYKWGGRQRPWVAAGETGPRLVHALRIGQDTNLGHAGTAWAREESSLSSSRAVALVEEL